MKKALVLTLLLLGVGAAAFAGPLSGDAEVCVKFEDPTGTGAWTISVFDTTIELDYTVGSFVFGINAIFDLDAFDNLYFEADGTLGTFRLSSMLDFEPQTPAFMAWCTSAGITLGGADLFAMFMVQNLGTPDEPSIGAGSLIGVSGTAGDVNVTAVSFFNMEPYLLDYGLSGLYFHFYGWETLASWDIYNSCGTLYKPYVIPWAVSAANCGMAWTAAGIYADFPFTCVDATVYATFSCTNGFDALGIWLTNINVGLPWLQISEVDIDFTVQSKSVFVYWDLILGDTVCITPYISLLGDNFYTIGGLELNALILEYSYNGVTIKAGEIFDHTWRSGYVSNARAYYFTLDGGLSYYATCYYNTAYDEFFGVWVDGDSCCGGAYDVSVINFFDTGSAGGTLFEWQETVASIEVGIGTNVSLSLAMSLKTDGLQWFKICGGFNF